MTGVHKKHQRRRVCGRRAREEGKNNGQEGKLIISYHRSPVPQISAAPEAQSA